MYLETHTEVFRNMYVCMYATTINVKRDHEPGRDPARVYGKTRMEESEGEMI